MISIWEVNGYEVTLGLPYFIRSDNFSLPSVKSHNSYCQLIAFASTASLPTITDLQHIHTNPR